MPADVHGITGPAWQTARVDAVVLLVVGLGAGIYGLVKWATASETAQWRAVRRMPRGAVGDLTEGQRIKLIGEAIGEPSLTAPVSGRPCLAFAVRREIWKKGEFSTSSKFSHLEHTSGAVSFVLDDGTGRVLVDASAARLLLVGEQNKVSASASEREVEWILLPGQQVVVAGHPVREPDPDAVREERGFRDAARTRWRLGGSEKHPVRISDAPGGFADPSPPR
jgi:hypothetical protein